MPLILAQTSSGASFFLRLVVGWLGGLANEKGKKATDGTGESKDQITLS